MKLLAVAIRHCLSINRARDAHHIDPLEDFTLYEAKRLSDTERMDISNIFACCLHTCLLLQTEWHDWVYVILDYG